MSESGGIWAVVPSKGPVGAKQRLSSVMAAELRGALALAMLEDVLEALAGVPELTGIAVVTADPHAAKVAHGFGARVLPESAAQGHTAAITTATHRLRTEGVAAMLALPGDIPLVTSTEIGALLLARTVGPCFVIVPAWDERGSNAVLAAPPGLVPLKYGDDSFLPHLAKAEALGVKPSILRLPGIALDIDTPSNLQAFLEQPRRTRARALLTERGFCQAYFLKDREVPHCLTVGAKR